MSYAIYKTEALVLRITPHGEANFDITFLTRDLGKIIARAQSVRKPESKMRMHSTKYNHVMIDVVRGKTMWRLTGIATLDQNTILKQGELFHAWYRALSLAEHLIRGEEPHQELFDFFIGLREARDNDSVGLELFSVIHVLDMLGYWHGEKLPLDPTPEILEQCRVQKKELIKMINESIEATQIVV